MTQQYTTIQVKQQRGKVTVQGLGRTDRGVRYIKDSIPLECTSIESPEFKSELEAAIKTLTA